jgi:hypothetical protein
MSWKNISIKRKTMNNSMLVINKIIEQLNEINIRTFPFQFIKNDESSFFIKFKKITYLVLNKRTFIKNKECPLFQQYIKIEKEIFKEDVLISDYINKAFDFFRNHFLKKYFYLETETMFIYKFNKPFDLIIYNSYDYKLKPEDKYLFFHSKFYFVDEPIFTFFDSYRFNTLFGLFFIFDHDNKTYKVINLSTFNYDSEFINLYILLHTEGIKYERIYS